MEVGGGKMNEKLSSGWDIPLDPMGNHRLANSKVQQQHTGWCKKTDYSHLGLHLIQTGFLRHPVEQPRPKIMKNGF